MFLLRQFFLGIPFELEEAASIDGANRLQCFWRIILPLSGPALASLAIFAFMFHWNNLLWPLDRRQHRQDDPDRGRAHALPG